MRYWLSFETADNNGRLARTGLHMPPGAAPASVLAFAALVRGPLLALTQNRLLGAKYIVSERYNDAPPAAAGADSRRSVSLFYSNGPLTYRLVVPAPRPELVETTGPWSGFRVTRETATAAGLLDNIENLPANTVTEDGEPFPTAFVVGSIDEDV